MTNKFIGLSFLVLCVLVLFSVALDYAEAVTISCQASPTSATLNQNVVFTANLTGPTENLLYDWVGACLSDYTQTLQTCQNSYSSAGNYTAHIEARDATSPTLQLLATSSCSVVVAPQCTTRAYKACFSGDSYWYDSCGNRQEINQSCGNVGCNTGGICAAPQLNVSCSSSPNPANINQQVNFTSNVSGGTGNFSYSWTGACSGNQANCYNSFSNSGTQTSNLTVTSGSQTQTANCSVSVQQQNNCSGRNFKACYSGNVYWFDSCSNLQDQYQNCQGRGCSNGQCQSSSNLTVSCAASPSSANTNQSVNFYAAASGGTGSYTYYWSGACTSPSYSSSYANCQNSFSTSGVQTANVTVYSGGQTASTSCSTYINPATNNYCVNSGSYYCLGNNVYTPQICYSNGQTYNSSQLAQTCSSNQTCQSGQCVTNYTPPTPAPVVYKSYKACSGSQLYWYSQYGNRLSLYSNCSSGNSCYVDSCSGNRCVNNLKCDGSTCAKSSSDYCKVCPYDGDGVCSCGETYETSKDCQACSTTAPTPTPGIGGATTINTGYGLVVSILGKKGVNTTDWTKSIAVGNNESFDILVLVNNPTSQTYNNAIVNIILPGEIRYKGNLKMDGNSLSGDIGTGINIGAIAASSSRTITFSGQGANTEGETTITATVKSDASSAVSDYLKVDVFLRTSTATIGSLFSNLFSANYFFLILLIAAIIIIALIFRASYASLRRAPQ